MKIGDNMILNGSKYKDRVLTVEQTLKLFKRSVEQCNVPVMLENSAQFLESFRNAENHFVKLDPKTKKGEMETYNKAQNLAKEYFDIRAGIRSFCECNIPK